MFHLKTNIVRFLTSATITSPSKPVVLKLLHVDPQLKYTIFCRPLDLTQQLLVQGKHVSK